jgi:hypothetical protein
MVNNVDYSISNRSFPFCGRFNSVHRHCRGGGEIWYIKNSGKIFTFASWRNGRVVDRGGLENRCACEGTGGSNPSFSAKWVWVCV